MSDSPLLTKFIDSLNRLLLANEVIYYFQEHPESYKTIEELATVLNRTPEELEPIILYLEREGILHNHGPIWGKPIYVNKYYEFYSFNPNAQVENVINRFEFVYEPISV
ncbi:MAG: hypothetical protein N3A72_08805 [bacterium]|nr:hypothetical protein [bacterium]